MTLEVAFNSGSLRLIHDELTELINNSATDFEAYAASPEEIGNLSSSRDCVAQVGGTFRLLQCPGAALLADEMVLLIEAMLDEDRKNTDSMITALTHSFFVLPRYIEFIIQRQHELPMLVIPYVNEMRIARKEPLLPEQTAYQGDTYFEGNLVSEGSDPDIKLLLATMPRLRYMYQTGLVGVLKEPKSSPHYLFMTRAVNRIIGLLGNHPCSEQWRLFSMALDAMAAGHLELTLNRKRILAAFEKLMRDLVANKEAALENIQEQLKQDVLFMIMLTDYSSESISSVRQLFSLPTPDINDVQVTEQRNIMHGPSQDTVESVTKVLREELHNAKDILELGAQNRGVEDEDLSLLKEILARLADTLGILNLFGPRETLSAELKKINDWSDGFCEAAIKGFTETADALLFIESALDGLNKQNVTVDELNKASDLARKKIIADSQLANAEQLVIEEAQAAIALIKRAITSYVDANFDSAHISNVSISLNTVRGGLYVLGYTRAAEIVKKCREFVTTHVQGENTGEQRHQLLETLADAVISLEYYLMELEHSREVNEDILQVAEESLSALGFAVDPV